MDRIKIELRNCYGIKALSREFDFSRTRAYALYAPNGVMKSSLAGTFQDIVRGADSSDRIFPARRTVREITDQTGAALTSSQVLVVLPYSEEFGVTEQTSTLLINPGLRREYEALLRATDEAKRALLQALRIKSRSSRNFETEISSALVCPGVNRRFLG